MLPVAQVDRWNIRTGYERVIAQHTGRNYAGVAEQDGVVESIDESLKLCKVRYKDGTTDVFNFGNVYTEHESVHSTQTFKLLVKPNQKLKRGDVIVYNTQFFYEDPRTHQVDFSIGVKANIALMEIDVDLEDSTEVSERLAKALTITPANARVVTLPKDAIIHMCHQVGDEVTNVDPLVIFEESAGFDLGQEFDRASDETLALMSELNRKTPDAKFTGKIVKIEAYYGGPISEMSSSLQPIVRKAALEQNRLFKAVQGTERAGDYAPSEPLPKYSKFKGIDFDETTVMLIFYIQESSGIVQGDKIVLGNQLKNTVSSVSVMPRFTEDGKEIDSVFSCEAVMRRICMSPLLMGVASQVVDKIEENIVDMYFNEKKQLGETLRDQP